MLNIDKVKDVYLACGATDFTKRIYGLALIMETQLNKDSYKNALLCFVNEEVKNTLPKS